MNLAETVLRKHQDAVFRIALQDVKSEGINTYSFGGLDYLSDKFATVLSGSGISQSDVVAVILPQSAAFAVAHLAVLKIGAIVLPISVAAEQSMVETFLNETAAKCLVIDQSIQPKFFNLNRDLLPIETIFVAHDLVSKNDFGKGFRSFWYEVNFADSDYTIVETDALLPAYIFFEGKADDNNLLNTFSHDEIIKTFQDLPLSNVTQEQRVFWTTSEWASPKIIFEMLFKSWFQGDAIASYLSELRNEKDAAEFFNVMKYIKFNLDANHDS
jgi:hypothetical protein